MPTETKSNILIEFVKIGTSVKVSAIDPVTSTEVCVVVPASSPRQYMIDLATRKLRYVMDKDKAGE